MRLLVQHRSRYDYPRPATLGSHLVRLRPANHTRARIESYGLHVTPACNVRWQQDPNGNHVARLSFEGRPPTQALEVLVELAVEVRQVNPFDFRLDDDAAKLPFAYAEKLRPELLPYVAPISSGEPGSPLARFLATLPAQGGTVDQLVALNHAVGQHVRYVIREEPGIWTPEETLENRLGSCRDSAWLLVAALRQWGLAARFVSGYLVQLTDEGMIPDAPRGVSRDVVDLHAWAEVYLPGAGWLGLDGTSGLFCGEGHIPLACTASASTAAAIDGTTDVLASSLQFSMTVGRLGHEPRPTAPFPESTWHELVAAGERTDAKLRDAGVHLTVGGEPTFNARDDVEAPEWNGEALGPSKWKHGLRLAEELRKRVVPGGVLLTRQGKHYPGEPLPRWALEVCGRTDGEPMWTSSAFPGGARGTGVDEARHFAEVLAGRLGLEAAVLPAYEDPWPWLLTEERLPPDEDPLKADLADPFERRRLAKLLGDGLGREVGFVLPLARTDGAWRTEAWRFRRGHLFLLPGDSAIGLRLPLKSLPKVPPKKPRREDESDPPDPRRGEEDEAESGPEPVRTALCVEPRDGALWVYLPPVDTAEDFLALVEELDSVRRGTGLDVQLEGYGPPSSPTLRRIAVTPDPGVLEVNLPPASSAREHAELLDTVFQAALHAGLQSEKYLLDGRLAGSGGGHHLTLGGAKALESPFVVRPDLLASLVGFTQHHPSLSYLFTGLFVGPTSQAPRLDEARHDSLEALEIAQVRAFDRTRPAEPWLADMLFRHLLVDVAGSTHRTELSIDKLYGPGLPSARQGLVELRAFEMPPHPRLAVAQMALVRALVAAFAEEPYVQPPVRWGLRLHDQFLLPHFLWEDFEDVLAHLAARGLTLPAEAYRPFLELRCPVAGRLSEGGVLLEVRNALEPWPVLGEEPSGGGTSRYVDSSMERLEIAAEGLVPGRHVVAVNGYELPMRPTDRADRFVAGVRFRAWAPPHSLHAHLGIHHPIRIDLVDTWGARSLAACAYHVRHPEGRAFDAPPLTRSEAVARREQRFTPEGPMPWPVALKQVPSRVAESVTLDLRRLPLDQPAPE